MDPREECVYMAKVAEQAERYEEMAQFMIQVAKKYCPLTLEERVLISVAFRNWIGARHAAKSVIQSISHKEMLKGNNKGDWTRDRYFDNIEGEMKRIIVEVVGLLDEFILPFEESCQGKVFFLKTKGDFCRYLAELEVGDERREVVQKTNNIYEEAFHISKNLKATDAIRLGVALNYSVFLYEIMNQLETPCKLLKSAFDDAIEGLDELLDDDYKDSTCLMSIIRDNLTLWTEDDELPCHA